MTPIPDPDGQETSVLPIVARRGGGLPVWVLVGAALGAALLLFGVLDARRRAAEAPSVYPRSVDMPDLPASVPTLDIPLAPEPERPPPPIYTQPAVAVVRPPAPAITPTPPPPAVLQVAPPPPVAPPAQDSRPVASGGAALVIDNTAPAGTPGQRTSSPAGQAGTVGASTERVRAGMLANRSTTVVQGTLIHAVLETGFDSTRAGFARAIVSRNVMSFDGTRVLIARGSRLIGEYQAQVSQGQKRALIVWARLIRPDGATIEIGSPAADPVGRGGVKADVNNHFLQRFSGAILQSALDVGVNLASRSADGTVIVALPNTTGGASTSFVQPSAIVPTLTIKPGVSISVFVARDLDFTDVENRP